MKVNYVDFPTQFKNHEAETMAAVRAVFEKGDFILGEAVSRFENEFAAIAKTKHAISVANGTDALILSLRALGVGAGDEVITASNSWVSSASAPALVGATPVFADVRDDQNIDPAAIERAITKRTRAIIPVHLTGRCAAMTEILQVANRHGIPVIEDAAQAVTATVDGYTAGNAGKLGCFSLHPLKNLNAAGDAGVITTDDDELAAKLRLLRHHGLKNREEVVSWGYNSRLDTLQAAVLLTRLPQLARVIESRRANAAQYIKLLEGGLEGVVALPKERSNERHTYHVFVAQCDRREQLQAFLLERGIETKIHYPIPIHQQAAAKYLGYGEGSLPVTERQAKRILSLPVHQYLTTEQIAWVAQSIREFYQRT